METVARSLLLGLALLGFVLWGYDRIRSLLPPPDSPAPAAIADPSDRLADGTGVVVTYFTTDTRCFSCVMIEALNNRFADELASGHLRFRTINIDRREHQALVEAYHLTFKTVVISEWRDGRERSWRKMDEVWPLLREPAMFETYLADEISRCLAPET